jgi:hypothetical protein
VIARRGVALPAALVLLAGCHYGDVHLQDRHLDPLPAHTITGGARCTLPAFQLRDTRPSPVLASVNGQQLIYDGLAQWTEGALRAAVSTDPSRRLDIELVRAYLEVHSSGHGFQLVLRVREDTTAKWRVYRGSDSGITWWGTGGEVGQYVENAARGAIRALVQAEADCIG